MERVGEEAAANAELKRKDCHISLNPEGCNLLESPTMRAPLRSDWTESSLRNDTYTTEAKDPHRCVTSLVGSEPPCTSPFSMNETGALVEELTVGNYRTQNSALASSPGRSKQGQWQHLHFETGSGYETLQGDFVSQDNDKVPLTVREKFMKMKSDVQSPNFSSRKRIDQLPEEISPCIRARDYMISSSNTRPVVGNQLKTLSTSGFSQFFVNKNLKEKGVVSSSAEAPRELGPMLKGKGVINRSTEARRELGGAVLGQNDEKLCLVTKVASNSLLKSNTNNDLLSSRQVDRPAPESFGDGICLREWLTTGCQKRERVESLHIFKQIVELVDSAQSQGLALQDLRPSYFCLWPMNRVKYTGSFVKESEYAINTKRPFEHDMQAYYGLGAKQQKLSDDIKSLTLAHHRQFASRFGSRTKKPNETYFDLNDSQNCGYFDAHTQNRSSYQSTFTTTGQQSPSVTAKLEEKWYISPEELNGSRCSFSSNIYGLGVLLFELLCYFKSSEVHATMMSNLRQRILPSNFLSENPMEAGFCLWLLHPEPSSRPKTREILHCELTSISQELHSWDDLSISSDDDQADSEILLHFLVSLKEQKQKRASKLHEDIRCLEEDLKEVEERHLQMTSSVFSQTHKACLNSRKQSLPFQGPTTSNDLPQSFPRSNMNESKLMRDISQLENAYFSIRSQFRLKQTSAAGRSDRELLNNRDRWSDVQNNNDKSNRNRGSMDHLGTFFEGLCKFARYSKFEVCGTLRNGDLLNSSNVICSLSFDRDEEYIAAAGVAKKIKIFEYKTLMNDSIDIHYPVVEMLNKSKLSCVSWNNYIKNYLASTDYDGAVQIWDASTGQGFSRYIEHTKRAWSVDFSQTDPTKFASGSDDCCVKLWSINEKSSAVTIRNAANVCCVQFSAFSSHLLAFGSADYNVHCYDLRNTRIPWCTLAGHEKAVSYVKFLDSETIVSASTDNSLKLWDLWKSSPAGISSGACSLTFRGHTNEKNFVGLSVMDGYIACGSETNEVYSYYRSLPMPITSHKFASTDPISGHEIGDDNGQFVSSVCWGQKSNMVVAANSSGCIKLLQMVQ